MTKRFKRGDHVEWNSEAGRVRGVIVKRVVSDVRFKGYVHHASKYEPQYIIKSERTDHVAIHKGGALKLVKAHPKRTGRTPEKRRKTKR
jgi:Hypervirulence associated proteins TUDOR domain